MLEKVLSGDRKYWSWIVFLLVVICIGVIFYLRQFNTGLTITGLSRDVSWGLYIASLTFFVGVAASAVMLVLPYYLHNQKEFGKLTILGEFLAVSAVIICVLSVMVDLGQPIRFANLFLHPSPNSPLFWDTVVLSIYMLLNLIIGWSTLDAERKGEPTRKWIKPLIYISIPWAISIHTVTAFIYSGLVARPFWFTALMAPRFLISAFASGPSLLIIIALILRRFSGFDPGKEALQKLAKIVAYAIIGTIFFILLEIFTVFYSGVPEHVTHFQYLFVGIDGASKLVPWIWLSITLAVIAIVLLVVPSTRRNEKVLFGACVAVFISIWIDKGLGLIIPGFIPSQTGVVFEYWPTVPELLILSGVWAIGFLILTILYKVVISVRREISS